MPANKPVLLVVDDEQMNRDALSRRLAKHGYDTALAASGTEALALVNRQPVDLVLLDVMMREMDGLEVLTSIRENYSLTEMPVIMVTARDQNPDVVVALQMGANDYVTKPINFPVILARIQTQLQIKSSAQTRSAGVAASPREAANHTVLPPESPKPGTECGAAHVIPRESDHVSKPTPASSSDSRGPATPAVHDRDEGAAHATPRDRSHVSEPTSVNTGISRRPEAPALRNDQIRIPGYEIRQELGRGSVGTVFKAKHTITNRAVALKLLRSENADSETIRRFFTEVQALGQKWHPNVVMVYDVGVEDNLFFFVMEYLDGVDAAKLIVQQGPLPVQAACDLIRQAAQGLQHIHQNNLVHRDIKPSNLFVARRPEARKSTGTVKPGSTTVPRSNALGVVKILDLGLALFNAPMEIKKVGNSLTHVGEVVGTVAYMAPEEWMNSDGVDIRADIYSLGCTFYFLLTGRVPFSGDTSMEVMIKHSQERPTDISAYRSDVPPQVCSAIQRMMAKRPADRFSTPAKVAEALT